jgi:hypothetical protein
MFHLNEVTCKSSLTFIICSLNTHYSPCRPDLILEIWIERLPYEKWCISFKPVILKLWNKKLYSCKQNSPEKLFSPNSMSFKSGWAHKVFLALRFFSDFCACAFLIFSIMPVVLYLLQITVCCITESYHGRLIPWNVYWSDKVLFQLTLIEYVSLFQVLWHAPVAVRPQYCLALP